LNAQTRSYLSKNLPESLDVTAKKKKKCKKLRDEYTWEMPFFEGMGRREGPAWAEKGPAAKTTA
jgi:hypothetical protein